MRISGNKLANEGFRVLVNIGNPSPDIKDMMVMPGLVENDYYFYIRHETNQIVYTIQKTRIRSYGAARDGRLLMAIAIPKGYEIDSVSPYDVLMDVYNTFISHYTTDSLGGTQFSNVEVDAAVFQVILDRYQLVPSKNRYLPMSPDRAAKALVLLPSSKLIADLMKDSQYVEFQSYGEILVAREGSTTYPKLSITVPRPIHYKVYINDVLSKTEINSLTTTYIASAEVGECFEYIPVKFTLADLKTGSIPPEVKLDIQRESVYCTLAKRPKVQNWKLVLEGEHPDLGQIVIRDKRSGEEIPVDSAGQFVLSGNQIGSPLELVCKNGAYIKVSTDVKDNVNRVFYGQFAKRQAADHRKGNQKGTSSQNVTFRIQPIPFKDHRINLFLEKSHKRLNIPQVQVEDGYASAEIPTNFFSPGIIQVHAESKHYNTFSGGGGRIDLDKEMDVNLFLKKKSIFSESWFRILMSGLIGLVVGILIGCLCSGGISSKDSGTRNHPDTQENRDTQKEGKEEYSEEEALRILKEADLSLTFKKVHDIYDQFKDSDNPDLKKKVEAFMYVVKDIENHKSLDNEKYSKDGNIGESLTPKIRAALQATYKGKYDFDKGTITENYSVKEREKAEAKYKEGIFISFKDLYQISSDIKQEP